MTISDAFMVDSGTGMPVDDRVAAPERARAGSGPRARIPVTVSDGKIGLWVRGFGATVASDLREAWWTPASLPTVQQAWVERMPDRGRVPKAMPWLYRPWVAYNHTVGLAVPAVAAALVGAISMFVWAARHPARLALFLTITGALAALTFG